MTTWDDKPNDYEHAVAEIERLRAAIDEQNGAMAIMHKARNKVVAVIAAFARNDAIEECARVAENNAFSLTVAGGAVGSTIAAAIRAQKGKL